MEQFLTFGIVGLSTAAIYAVIGSGLVLTYATTNVFNFAHGAAGMMAAFAYWQLTVGWGWPVPVALAVVLLVLAPAFGLAAERFILRPVQHLGDAERLVTTIALLSGLIAVAGWIWDPNVARPLPAFLADKKPIHLGPATVTWHQAVTVIVAVAVAVALRILLYRSRIGAEMRATVDDRTLTILNGGDPVRANRTAWILGTQLAAIGGILIAPSVTLDPAQLSLVIVSAYTAAVFGRLRSLSLTFVGAIVLGCTESYLTGYLPQNQYLPGIRLAAPAILLFLALLLFPHRQLRGRGRRARQVPVPSVRGTLALAVATVALGVVLATVLSDSDRVAYGSIFSLGIVALSYVPLTGYAGQISLCQLGIAGIGAIVCGHLGMHGEWWALPAAVVISAVVGVVIAIPALRLSGIYLALGTTAFAVILDRWIFTLPSFHVLGIRIALFDQGSVQAMGPDLFGLHLNSSSSLMILAAVCLALVSIAVAFLRRGRFGRRLIALRDSEAAYATLGGDLVIAKAAVFAVASAIAGLGGGLYAMQERSVTADQFGFVAGLPVFLLAVVAGLGFVGSGLFVGTVLGGPLAVLGTLAPWTQHLSAVAPGLTGIGIGGNPDGALVQMRQSLLPLVRHRIALLAAVGGFAVIWVLRIGDVIDGWALFFGSLAIYVLLQAYAAVRRRATVAAAEPDVPVEWWGLRRDWRPEDEEALAHGIAAG